MSSSTKLKTPLPVEILDHILEDLDSGSPDANSSLLACSYANRAFGAIAQKRLFRDLSISIKVSQRGSRAITFYEDNDGLTTGRKLLDLLNISPHIASFIQSITVTDAVQPSGTGQPVWSPRPNSIKSNNSEFPLYIITARAKNLKKLFFTLSSLDALRSFWSSMPLKMQDFLTQLTQRLPGIGLHSFRGVPMSIFHSSIVHELQISHIDMNTDVVPPSKVKLESLDFLFLPYTANLSERVSWFNSPSSAFEITDLRILKVSPNAFPGLEDILALCSKSLRSLDLQAINGFSWVRYGSDLSLLLEQGNNLDLGSLQSLSELTISAYFGHQMAHMPGRPYEPLYDTDLLYVFRALKTLPTSTVNSQTLQINVCICMRDIPQDLLGSIAWSGLICSVLNEEEMEARWANLRLQFRMMVGKQEIDISGVWSPRDTLDEHEDLKNLRLKGLLSY